MTITQKIPPIMQVLIGAVLIGILLVLVKWGAPVLTPVMVAAFLASLAAPLFFWLQRKGLSSTWSLIILIVLMIVVVLALAGLLWLSATRMIEGLTAYQTDLSEIEENARTLLADVGVTEATVTEALSGDKLKSLLLAILNGVVAFVGDLIFGLVLVSFLLVDFRRLMNLATSELSGRPVFGKLPEIAKSAGTYFGVRTRLNLVTGVGFGLLLWILGVDYAFLWGAMAFLLSYIPYVGLFMATIPPFLLAWAEFGPGVAVVVAVGSIVINLAIENFIEPRLTAQSFSLSPVMVLLAFFFFGWLLGSTGALLSMPIMVTIMLVTSADERTAWISRIIGSDESEESEDEE